MPSVSIFLDDILNEWLANDTNYLFVEFHQHYPSFIGDNVIRHIQTHCEPEWKIEDPCVTFEPFLWESELLSEKAGFNNLAIDKSRWNNFRLNPSERDKFIEVYNLNELFEGKFKEKMLAFKALKTARKLMKDGQVEKALPELRTAGRIMKDNGEIDCLTGQCFFNQAKYKWSARAFEKGLSKKELTDETRKQAEAFLDLCRGLESSKDRSLEKAVAHLEAAASYFKGNTAFEALIGFELSVSYFRLGKTEKARETASGLRENSEISPELFQELQTLFNKT
jgi:hypothetical protein